MIASFTTCTKLPTYKGVNKSNQTKYNSIPACLIILTNLKFCLSLTCLFAEPSFNELSIKIESYWTWNAIQVWFNLLANQAQINSYQAKLDSSIE